MTNHSLLTRLTTLAVACAAALLAVPAAAQAEPCDRGRSIGAGLGDSSFYLWSCSRDKGGGREAYAQFISGPTSTRATACKIWIRPERSSAKFFDCTPMLRVGRYRTYTHPLRTRTRSQACYLLRYGTGTWTRSYCVWSG